MRRRGRRLRLSRRGARPWQRPPFRTTGARPGVGWGLGGIGELCRKRRSACLSPPRHQHRPPTKNKPTNTLRHPTQTTNRRRQEELARRDAQERLADEAIVQEGLRATAAAEAAERAAKEARRSSAVAHCEQVVAQMEREQAASAAAAAELQAAMDAQQARRDAELAGREAARQRLWGEVAATREQQVAAKQAAVVAEASAAREQRLAVEAEARREAEVAVARRQRERQQETQLRLDLEVGGWWRLLSSRIGMVVCVAASWSCDSCDLVY